MTENNNVETILKNGDKTKNKDDHRRYEIGFSQKQFVAAAKASSQAAKERAEAAKNMSPQITALYYDAASGTMKTFDPTKNTQEEMQKLVENVHALFIS